VNLATRKVHGYKEIVWTVRLADLGCARVLPKDKHVNTSALVESAAITPLASTHASPRPEMNASPTSGVVDSLAQKTLTRYESANTAAFKSMIRDHHQHTAMTDGVGSMWYRAPECLVDTSGFKQSADVWALGVTMRQFVTGKVSFPGNSEQEVLNLILPHYRRVPPALVSALSAHGVVVDEAKCSRRHLHTELSMLQVIC
jgi:serine/threonine protein kinase